jgi:RNA-directed DNA polymerase
MTTENRRNKANAGMTERNSDLFLNSAMVDKAKREESILPDSQRYIHVSKIEGVVNDYNIQEATKVVIRNKGAPGVDGITTEEITDVLKKQWPKIKQDILNGIYRPSPGVRKLGIPTVMDRIIQQAIYQEIVYTFEPTFSDNSYGFRLGRRAQQAVLKAQTYIKEGCEWVVDIDLEKFFDRVNHDILMARVARKVKDKKLLLLIRRYLQAGVMEEGLVQPTEEGTPQGGPLSPLLSNIMLDDFDKELEKRGLRFARYADDCNIYVRTEIAGQRVMKSVVKYLTTKLKLKVNEQKSAVARPWERKFLGFTFGKEKESGKIKIHESRVKRLQDKIRGLTKKMRGSNVSEKIRKVIMPITRGWVNYFRIAEIHWPFQNLDGWIRRKIRATLWRQWKNSRTRCKKLMALGLKRNKAKDCASGSKGPWRMARTPGMHKALSNKVIENMGYIPMMTLVCDGS